MSKTRLASWWGVVNGSILLLGSVFALTACKATAAEARFAADYNCSESEAERLSNGTYRVKGCGAEATYSCVKDDWSQKMSGITCIREATDEPRRAVAPPPPFVPRKGVVARSVDNSSGARGVTADVPLLLGGMPGPVLRLKVKPGDDPARVWIAVSASIRQLDQDCEGLALVVNGAAFLAAAPKRSRRGAVETISATFAADTLQPLSQQYPTFGVKACSTGFEVPDEELRNVQKFLAIRQELAQSGAPASPTPPPAPDSVAPPHPTPAASSAASFPQ